MEYFHQQNVIRREFVLCRVLSFKTWWHELADSNTLYTAHAHLIIMVTRIHSELSLGNRGAHGYLLCSLVLQQK